jgi:hypothetical protein
MTCATRHGAFLSGLPTLTKRNLKTHKPEALFGLVRKETSSKE